MCGKITKKAPERLWKLGHAYQPAQSSVANLNIQIVFKLYLNCIHKLDRK